MKPLAPLGAAVRIGGEAYQRAFHIVKQTRPGARRRAAPGDQHVVVSGPSVKGRKQPRGLAQPALGAVSRHGVADLAGGGEADADKGGAVGAITRLHDDRAPRGGGRAGAGQEIRPVLKAFDGEGGFAQRRSLR